jgi:putative membrane protein
MAIHLAASCCFKAIILDSADEIHKMRKTAPARPLFPLPQLLTSQLLWRYRPKNVEALEMDHLRDDEAAQNEGKRELWKGVAAGVIGGLVASWTMNQVFTFWSKMNEGKQQEEQSAKKGEQNDPATLKLAKRLSRDLLHREIPDDKAKQAEAAVHYGFGAVMGGVYGGLSEYVPQTRAGLGSAFATALFVGADEIAVPLAGLSGKPTEVPVSGHVLGLTAHLVYGLTTELVRRETRKLLAA